MDETIAARLGFAAFVAVAVIVFYVIRGLRLRAVRRRIGECLAGYFSGDLALDQFAQRAREAASRRFMGSPECQALVQAAFQRAAEAKLAGREHSLDVEKRLLGALAAVREEFGLPERYRNEGWKAGRE
jgi:hypothetical protein